MASISESRPDDGELALFPLQSVLFPDGLLGLKVFEARYLDLMSTCLRDGRPFGVIALRSGEDTLGASKATVAFEEVGTTAELLTVDSQQPGILLVKCRGGRRFSIESARQQPGGLWTATIDPIADDEMLAPAESMVETVRGLATLIGQLAKQQDPPVLQPYRFDDAGWVANRWCELLPISQAAKQKLMELPDAMVRLQLVDDFLRSKGVVS